MRRVAVLLGGALVALAACGSRSAAPTPTPSSSPAPSSLAAELLPAPPGFTLATGTGAHDGPLDAAGFDALFGAGSASTLGFHDGAQVGYQQTTAGYGLEIGLFRFAAVAGASDFASTVVGGVRARTTPAPTVGAALGIPEGVEVVPSGASTAGVATYGVIAVRGEVVMVLDYSASYDPANRTFVESTAQLQYALLPAT